MDKDRLSRALFALNDLVSRLRGRDGCPWDALQTDSTIRMYLLEEAYEVLDAIERGTPEDVRGELGDLLFQILFLVRLAEERGEFDLIDVLEQITDKMKNRHPHVFGEADIRSAEEVADNWQKLKRREKEAPGTLSALLEGVPMDLPALLRTQRLTERVSRADLDWPEGRVEWVHLAERFEALEEALSGSNREQMGQVLGELLFDLANLARERGLNAESLLRRANQDFIQRMEKMEGEPES